MYEYIVPLLILGAIAAAAFIVIRAVFSSPTSVEMEIVINADEENSETERAVVTTRYIAEKYFKNAKIYLRGKDEKYIQYLCRTYGVLHRE